MDGLVFISHSSEDKALANLICSRLEAKGIPCWIAPRNITTSDWAQSIMLGLRDSEVFVVILSKNSIPSPEVLKEVTEATKICPYLVPFKIDNDALSDRLQYHLGPCHWLNAVDPPIEERVDELAERIRNLSFEDVVYLNARQMKIVDKMTIPHGLFVGREREIKEMYDALTESRALFLCGMGGIGKTEIVKNYAKIYRDQYHTIVFAQYASNLLDLLCGNEIEINNLVRTEGETQEAWVKRKLETLRILADEKTLIVIDNFDVPDDPLLVDLLNVPARFVFTTRFEFGDYRMLRIDKIRDSDKVRSIFMTHYGRSVPPDMQDDLDKILELVNYHTITVELIAKQMRASFLKPRQMLERIEGSGLNTHLKEKISGGSGSERKSAFDMISSLFSTADLSEEEKYILRCMCYVPTGGIDISLFSDILQLEDFDTINKLLSDSWLSFDDESDTLAMHPVIRDVAFSQLAPTPLICEQYVRGLHAKTKGCWFFTIEERNRLYPLVVAFLKKSPMPILELWDVYVDFQNIAWICGDFERAADTGKKAYDFSVASFGEASIQSATAALYLAGSFHNGGDELTAEGWYKTALANFLSCPERNDADIAQCMVKVGRSALYRGDIESAEEYYKKAEKIYENLLALGCNSTNSKYPKDYGNFVMELERLEIAKGNYDKALTLCNKSYMIYNEAFGEKNSNSAYSLVDMGLCCSGTGKYEDANRYFEMALEINLLRNGRRSIQTVRTRESIAENVGRSGNVEEAKKLLTNLEMDMETDFGPDNPYLKALREKFGVLQ